MSGNNTIRMLVPPAAAKAIGERIVEIRTEQGYTQVAFANAISITAAGMSAIERGRQSPSMGLLFRIASQLKVPVAALVDRVDGDADEGIEYRRGFRHGYLEAIGRLQASIPSHGPTGVVAAKEERART